MTPPPAPPPGSPLSRGPRGGGREERSKSLVLKGRKMKYRVHHLKVSKHGFQPELAEFLNSLNGEVISVVPNVAPCFLFYGAKVDYVLIVEKIK